MSSSGPDLVEPPGEPQRVRVQRLLEQRAREARVAEALAALRRRRGSARSASTAPSSKRYSSPAANFAVIATQLVGRVVRERDLAREARLQPGFDSRKRRISARVAGDDHDEAVAVVLHPLEQRLDRLGRRSRAAPRRAASAYASSMKSTPSSARRIGAVGLDRRQPDVLGRRGRRGRPRRGGRGLRSPIARYICASSRATVVLPVPGLPRKTRCWLVATSGEPVLLRAAPAPGGTRSSARTCSFTVSRPTSASSSACSSSRRCASGSGRGTPSWSARSSPTVWRTRSPSARSASAASSSGFRLTPGRYRTRARPDASRDTASGTVRDETSACGRRRGAACRAPRSPARAGTSRPASAPARCGASARNSSPSRRVRFATERSTRSPQSSSYGNDGMSLMWIPAQTTEPPFATAASAAGTSSPTGAKMIAASSSSGGAPAPAHSAPSSRANACASVVALARHREHAPALVPRHLRDDVRGRAEAVEAEPLRVAREPQRPVTRSAPRTAAAPPRRSPKPSGIGKQNRSSATDPLRVAAVDVVAGEAREVAEVLAARRAVPALAARPAEPRNAEPRARRRSRRRSGARESSGSFGRSSSPSTMCRSVRQTPQASTRSSTCTASGLRNRHLLRVTELSSPDLEPSRACR